MAIRQFGIAGAATQLGFATPEPPEAKPTPKPLDLSQYEPKSMLHVHEARVERSKYPVIDLHTHISGSKKSKKGLELSAERGIPGIGAGVLAVMDRKNIRAMVNLTGGYGKGLAEAVTKYDRETRADF